MKSGTSNTTSGPGDSTTSNKVGLDAMTWASTWEMKNRTLEEAKKFKDDSDGCIHTWVEIMRLHLEQDNLNDERQACTAILSNGRLGVKVCSCKEGRGT